MDFKLPFTRHTRLTQWLKGAIQLCEPLAVEFLSSQEQQARALADELIAKGSLIELNPQLRPFSFLARSSPEDVARVEAKTYICTPTAIEAGPSNHWEEPLAMKQKLNGLFQSSMRGRTCYVIAFCMGPLGSKIARYGVQVTDSAYVALNMRLMTHMGEKVWQFLSDHPEEPIVWGWHSVGQPLLDATTPDEPWPCNREKLSIAHFPQDREIWSYGSGYGGNALLGKKCLALRIGSYLAHQEGWLAEHMLIMALTNPQGEKHYIAAAFPSSCGKTNLALLQPTLKGWKVECVGDDIAWLWVDETGQLRAVNPEAGFFGVAPGTSVKSNPVAMQTIASHTLFTNVALTAEKDVWWEGLDKPEGPLTDWQGKVWESIDQVKGKAAQPNSRFTVAIEQCPILDQAYYRPEGVVISALLFGGRRSSGMPLVWQSHDWDHGVLMGSSLSSETTSAAEGESGLLRRDPFAMLPFCGYHMGEYFAHWLQIGKKLKKPVAIFGVNWFRKDSLGHFIWPGFGDNVRILKWIFERLEGKVGAQKTPIGFLPNVEEIEIEGLNLTPLALKELVSLDQAAWLEECKDLRRYFEQFDPYMPSALIEKLSQIEVELNNDSYHL